MINQHPITPPRGLVVLLRSLVPHGVADALTRELWLINRAYAAGADQELEACVELTRNNDGYDAALGLRAARRPKPPSLKKQAMLQLDTLIEDLAMHGRGCDLSQIRKALEELPND